MEQQNKTENPSRFGLYSKMLLQPPLPLLLLFPLLLLLLPLLLLLLFLSLLLFFVFVSCYCSCCCCCYCCYYCCWCYCVLLLFVIATAAFDVAALATTVAVVYYSSVFDVAATAAVDELDICFIRSLYCSAQHNVVDFIQQQ